MEIRRKYACKHRIAAIYARIYEVLAEMFRRTPQQTPTWNALRELGNTYEKSVNEMYRNYLTLLPKFR